MTTPETLLQHLQAQLQTADLAIVHAGEAADALEDLLQDPPPAAWRTMLARPPRPGTYRVRILLEIPGSDDPLDTVTLARWDGTHWLDALPPHAITHWHHPGDNDAN